MSMLAIPRWLRLPHTGNFQSIILRADPGILAELVPLLDALPVPAAALHRPRLMWIGWDDQWCWLGTPASGDARWLVPVLSTIRNWADARECYHDSGEQPIFGEGAPDVWWPWYVFTRDRRGGVWIRGVSQPANPFPLHQLADKSAHARTTPAGQRFEQVGNALHRTGLPVTYGFALQLYRAGYGLWNGPPDLRRRCQAFEPSDLTPPELLQNLANQLHNTRWGPAARYAELLDRSPTALRRALLRELPADGWRRCDRSTGFTRYAFVFSLSAVEAWRREALPTATPLTLAGFDAAEAAFLASVQGIPRSP